MPPGSPPVNDTRNPAAVALSKFRGVSKAGRLGQKPVCGKAEGNC